MRKSILFYDMKDFLLPMIQSVEKEGFFPIVQGAPTQQLEKGGFKFQRWEEFRPPDVSTRAQGEIQRIAKGLEKVLANPLAYQSFSSSFGSFLPHTGERFFRRLLERGISEIIALETFENLALQHKMALVVLRTENNPEERAIIRLAAKHEIPTLHILHGGWFGEPLAPVAGEYDRALRSDYVAVGGQRAFDKMVRIGVHPERIFITGISELDYSAEAHLEQCHARQILQLSMDKPVVLLCTAYANGSSALYPFLVRKLLQVHQAVTRAIQQVHTIQLIVRPHPWEIGRVRMSPGEETALLDAYKKWLAKEGIEHLTVSREKKIESLRAADVVIVEGNSTVAMDAMISQRPVVMIPLGIEKELFYTPRDGISIIGDLRQLPSVLANLLRDPTQREAMVERQNNALPQLNYGNDGRARERLADLIVRLANQSQMTKSKGKIAISSEISFGDPGSSLLKTKTDDSILKLQGHNANARGDNKMADEKRPGFYIHQAGKLSKGAVLDVGLKCTHSCRFCYYSYLDGTDEQFRGMRRAKFRTLEECKQILGLLKQNAFINFDVTGGEPTLHPDIIEITQYAHQELGLKGRIITLGQFLMRKMTNCKHDKLIDALLDAGLTNFLFSFHAADEALFHKITDESYERLLQALSYLDEKGFQYTCNTTVFEWNYKHLPALAKEITRHAIYLSNFIIMNAYHEWNKEGRAFGVQAKYSDIHPYLKEAVDILESNNVGVNIRYAPLCTVKGMEKNLVGIVGVRYDPYEWMNRAGHKGGSPQFCASLIPLKEGEIGAHVAYRDLTAQFENGVKITGVRGNVKYFSDPCVECRAKDVCDGIDPNYLKIYGPGEFSPYQEAEKAPLQKARCSYIIPFIVKTEQYTDMKAIIAREFKQVSSRPFRKPGYEKRADEPIRVSVIIPCYNYGKYLEECVKSVIDQTDQDFEIIIVNDGSTDNTKEVAEQLITSHPGHRIKLINQTNSGQPAISRNNGIKEARGKYVLPLDADDLLPPQALELYRSALSSYGDQQFIAYGWLQKFGATSNLWRTAPFAPKELLHRTKLPYSSLYHRSLWERLNGYRTNVKGYEDWDFWIGTLENGARFVNVPAVTTLYRETKGPSLMDFGRKRHEWNVANIILNHKAMYEPEEVTWAGEYLDRFPEAPETREIHGGDEKVAGAVAVLISSYPELYTDEEVRWAKRILERNAFASSKGDWTRPRSVMNRDAEALGRTSAILDQPSATDCFVSATEKFQGGYFLESEKLMEKYRASIHYESFLKTDHRQPSLPAVSVVIVAYKTNHLLLECLVSLSKQTCKEFEVIIVDNGGNDAVEERIRSLPLLYIKCPINFAPSEGRNIGASFSRAEVIAFLDDDALVDSSYVSSILEAFKTHDVYGFRGKVLPKTHHQNNELANHYELGNVSLPMFVNTEGNSAFRKAIYKEMMGMNPLYFGYEGVELSYRIYKKYGEGKTIYWPRTVIYHDYASSADKLNEKYGRHHSMEMYLKGKYPDLFDHHTKLMNRAKAGCLIQGEQTSKLRMDVGRGCEKLRLEEAGFELEAKLQQKGWREKEERYRLHFESVCYQRTIQKPSMSIIVISWRSHPDTLRSFQILAGQRHLHFELIFVDNGGKVGEFDTLKEYIDTYVKLKDNTGAYLARNIGALFSKAPILFFLEDDGIPETNLIQSHLRAFREYEVIAVRGVYRPKSNNPLNSLARHYYLGDRPFPHYGDLEGNISYESSLFYEVGGWDDEIRFGHGGADLSIRLLHVEPDRRKQIYSPDPIIYHDYAENEDHLRNKKKKQHESRERLCQKHPEFDSLLNRWGIYFQRKDALILRRPSSTAVRGKHGKAQDQKGQQELQYWKHRKADEGMLPNTHYEYFYTTQFGLQKSFYDGKKILDIGCGPRGSLEWADNALERVGLDPLVEEYRELGIDDHKMKYVASYAENIPYPEGYFDVVCAFNSLDHVQDFDKTIEEIQRVLAPGGLFLLITDVNHPPTVCEPISYGWEVTEKLSSDFDLLESRQYEKGPRGIYQSLRENKPYDHTNRAKRYGVLTAKFVKQPADGMTVGRPVSIPSKNAAACPVISIVVPTFNRSEYLKDAIESALSQKYDEYEIVIVDDGSTDNTADVVRGFNSDKIGYIRKEHSGAPGTRNLGIAEAKGEFILWLDSDDVLLPGTLQAYVDAIKKAPDVDVLYGDLIVTDASLHERRKLAYKDWYGRPKELISFLIGENPVPNPGVLIRKNCYEKFGNYDELFTRAHDYEFWSRIAGRATFKHIGKVVAKWRLHDSNWAGGKVKVDTHYEARVVKKILERYSLRDIYPDINWEESKNKAEADALSQASIQLMRWGDLSAALHYLQKSHELFPTEEKEKGLRDLKLKINAGMLVGSGYKSRDKNTIHSKKKKLTVTYLISNILGVTGGNQTLLNQANALIDRGHRVHIVTYSKTPDYFTIKANIIRVPHNEPMSKYIPKSDAVISTYFTNTVELTRTDAPVRIYYAQGDQFIFEDETIQLSPEMERKKKVAKEISKASYLYPGIKFVANSHNLAHAVEKAYGRKADEVLPVCVDSSIFHPLSKEKKDGRKRILVVGPDTRGNDLEPLIFKGIGDIREALDQLSSKRNDFVVVRMSNTEAHIFKDFQCEFYIVPNDQLKTFLYGNADILVYASHYDSCPRPPMEAMASGTAVVCTETSGALEYCRDGENCLLVPIKSPHALCDSIERLMDDKMLREKLVRGGFETAGQYPQKREWDELENLLHSFYHEVVKPRSVVKGLTSIVVVLNNEQERARECIQSIEKFTLNPFEVVLVCCNSKANSVKGISKVIKGKENYKLIEGDKNADETRRRNQGIEAATGEYILLLENDVVVTEAWLSGMLEYLNSSSDIGIVGPVTNNIRGPQKVENVGYTSVNHLPEYAEGYREKYRHRRIPIGRIAGFCMLFRRELVDRIGLLDESFGAGNLEDDDFCLRAELAGYRNFIAGDVFIHHYGSRSFTGNKIDYRKTMKGFLEKWNSLDPQSAEGKKYLSLRGRETAQLDYEKGQAKKAVDRLLAVIRLGIEAQESYLALAEILLDAKQYDQAFRVLNQKPDADQDDRKYALLGYCQEGLANPLEAQKLAEQALSLNPSNALALNLKGILSYRKGDKEEAQNYFQRAAAADRGFGEPHTNLGVIRWEENRKKEALPLFERGFILSPTITDILQMYHTVITEEGEFARAEQNFREAQTLHPFHRGILFFLIDILLKQGKNEEAMEQVEQSMTHFGIEDEMLSAALEVRKRIGPQEKSNQGQGGRISLCMIVKDEEKDLLKCLRSVKPVVDEMIVVDTGSADRTKDIATALGAKVFEFPWEKDFSAARNFSISQAKGDWILVLDADEVISPLDHASLLALTRVGSRKAGYSLVTRNYLNTLSVTQWTANDGTYDEEAGSGWIPSEKVRLFPRDRRIHFENPVHEFVEPSLERNGIPFKKCSIPVHHYGKLNEKKEKRKGEDYFLLGKKKLERSGADIRSLRELAVQANVLKRYEESAELWHQVIRLQPEMPEPYFNLTSIYMNLGKFQEASAHSKKAIELDPDCKEAVLNYSIVEFTLGNIRNVISALESLLSKIPEYPLAMALLSVAYRLDGERDKSQSLIAKIKKAGFNYDEYLQNTAKNLIALGRSTEAGLLSEITGGKEPQECFPAVSVP